MPGARRAACFGGRLQRERLLHYIRACMRDFMSSPGIIEGCCRCWRHYRVMQCGKMQEKANGIVYGGFRSIHFCCTSLNAHIVCVLCCSPPMHDVINRRCHQDSYFMHRNPSADATATFMLLIIARDVVWVPQFPWVMRLPAVFYATLCARWIFTSPCRYFLRVSSCAALNVLPSKCLRHNKPAIACTNVYLC